MLSVLKFGRRLMGLRPATSTVTRNIQEIQLLKLQPRSVTASSMSQYRVSGDWHDSNLNHTSEQIPQLVNVEASVEDFRNRIFRVQEQMTIYEKEPNHRTEEEAGEGSRKAGRKFGVFLTGSALGGIASTFWTYGQLKQQQKELSDLDGKEDLGRVTRKSVIGLGKVLHAAEVLNPDQVPPQTSKSSEKPNAPSRRDRFNFIAEVVEETAPALVYIQIKNLGVRDFYTGEALTTSNGSGFLVRSDGLILTNAHVVLNKPRSSVQVTLQDGRTFIGVVEDADVGSDLATVRIPAKDLPTMKLGKSSTIRPGEFVIAMGSPLSLTNTITTGVVSSPARNKSELHLRGRNVSEYIQTDAAITFGNSGGPLLNLDGEAIGINSMKLTPGISFAIPIDHAKEFLQKNDENRRSNQRPVRQRRYMGITMVALDDQVIQELRMRHQLPHDVSHGILVFRMVQDSPADRSGLKPGDIITHINGAKIVSSGDVYKFLESTSSLDVTIVRKGVRVQLEVDLDV